MYTSCLTALCVVSAYFGTLSHIRAMSHRPVTIKASGKHSVLVPAERAVLRLAVEHTSTDQSETYDTVAKVTNELSGWFKELSPKDASDGEPTPDATITSYTMGALTTNSWTPYSPPDENGIEKKEPPREYRVRTHFEVEVQKLEKLSEMALVLAVRR